MNPKVNRVFYKCQQFSHLNDNYHFRKFSFVAGLLLNLKSYVYLTAFSPLLSLEDYQCHIITLRRSSGE